MLITPTRRRLLTGLGCAGLGFTGAYAFAVEPRFRLSVTRYAPHLPRWPSNLPLRIAVIADIHVGGPWMPLERVAEIVDATNALQPDLILLLGDYPASRSVGWKPVPLVDLAWEVARLRAPHGVFAILGNHDWWEDPVAMRRRRGPVEAQRVLERKGVPVLENDAIRLEKDGRAFWLAGLGDQLPFVILGDHRSHADLPATLAQVSDDAPVILMIHEPDLFPQVPGRVALTLAGHTHGGQIQLLGYPPFLGPRRRRYAYGHVVEQDRHLIVSGGLGVSRVGVRFGVPPEIVLVELATPEPQPRLETPDRASRHGA